MLSYWRSHVLVLSHKTRRSLILATNSKIELKEWIERLRVAVSSSPSMMFEEVTSLDRFTRHDIDSSSITTTTSKENVRPSNTSHPKKTTQPQLSFLTATLPNEVVKLHIRLCYFDPTDRLDLDSLRGQLLVTNYMVCFIPNHKNTLSSSSSKFFELPLGTIERIEKVALEKGEGAFLMRLYVFFKIGFHTHITSINSKFILHSNTHPSNYAYSRNARTTEWRETPDRT